MSCFLLPASCFLLPASCFLLPASCFLLPASCFLPSLISHLSSLISHLSSPGSKHLTRFAHTNKINPKDLFYWLINIKKLKSPISGLLLAI
ncbi:hypothetical protein IPC877_16070 [Pseudomonas aeruginosa]|nr:hypothetical protein IPC877_16070 [Pseudomonas aeruginosa]